MLLDEFEDDDEQTISRGDSFSLFLPISEKEDLLAFLATRQKRGAIEIGGRKWAASLRYPFPREERWLFGWNDQQTIADKP